jgi:anti-anti-sigma factor
MKVTVSEFGDVGKRFTLVGRLDILGSEAIDLPLAVVAGSGTNIVVDLGGVDFIGSLAMRHLVLAARAVARRSRNLILLNPRPLVRDALTKGGLVTILRIVDSEDEAKTALSGMRDEGRSHANDEPSYESSVLLPTDDSQAGANLRVCVDDRPESR